MAAMTRDERAPRGLQKTHVGEFQAMPLKCDEAEVKELAESKEEIEELVGDR